MNESELRAYVVNSFDQLWKYPAGEQVFSQFTDRTYVCITSKQINFWDDEGKLTRCAHDAETRARYELLLNRTGNAAE